MLQPRLELTAEPGAEPVTGNAQLPGQCAAGAALCPFLGRNGNRLRVFRVHQKRDVTHNNYHYFGMSRRGVGGPCMKKRGRPSVYSLETGRSLEMLIAGGATKKQACIDMGVAYSSFMRWQARDKRLRTLIEEATKIRHEKHRREAFWKGLFSEQRVEVNSSFPGHNRRPYRDKDAQPAKWMKLIGVVVGSQSSD